MRALLLLFVSVGVITPLLAQPSVVQVSPAANVIAAAADAPIVVNFSQPVDAESITPQSVRVFGRWSGPARGTFEVTGAEVRFTPEEPLFAGEWVTVSLSRAITSGGVPMAHGYAWNYWVATAPGSLDFVERGRLRVRQDGEGQVQVYGAYAGDLNDDGWSDLTVINEQAHDMRVYLNDGAGAYDTFTEYALIYDSFPSPNEGADFNGDGFIDLAVGAAQGEELMVFMGDGLGGFASSEVYLTDRAVRGVGVIDLDGDGHDDIITANRVGGTVSMFMNNGDGTFAEATTMDPGAEQETAAAVADANGDGIMDVFVGALASREILLLLGDGEGGLTVSDRKEVPGSPWMITVGDVNGDGFADVVSANVVPITATGSTAAVVLSDGQGGLQDAVAYPSGEFPVAIDVGDMDGDGDLDLITSNLGTNDWTIYENAGDGTFINPRTLEAVREASCAVLHDRDNDGDLDITATDEGADMMYFFENTGVPVSAEEAPTTATTLAPSYPNPFSSRTTLSYTLARRTAVRLSVFDMLGREVATVVDQVQAAGPHTAVFDAAGLPGGVYVYRLQTDEGVATQALLLQR